MGLVQDYYDLYDYYSKKFEKVAVLLQCGSFYELYQDKEEVFSNAKEISRIIHCVWKPKDHRYPDSTHLVGFGITSYDKFTRILKQNGYTCIIVNQVVCSDNCDEKYDYVLNSGDEVRAVTDILCPSTDFDSENLSNHVVCIYLENYSEKHYSIGVAVTDILVSNEIFVAEWVTDIANFDDLNELLLFYKPIETYIISKCEPKVFKGCKWIPLATLDDQIDTVGYSDAINSALKGILKHLQDRLVSVKNQDFSIKYYESLCSDHLELTSTAIKQLDIDLLFPILNKTQTAMGSRLLEARLKKPFYKIDDVLESYDTLTEIDLQFATSLKNLLANVPDLDRLIRRLETGNFTRNNFFCLKKVLLLLKNELVHNEMLDDILQHCFKLNDDNQFVKGYCTILDGLYQSQVSVDSKIKTTLRIAALKLKNVKISSFKIKENLGFVTTNTRAAELKRHFKTWKFTALGKETVVSNEQLLLDLDLSRQTEIYVKTQEKIVFEKFLQEFCQYLDTLKVLSEKLALLDFYQSAYFCNEIYHLVKPEILQEDNCLNITQVRHMVIEKYNSDVQFIPNDLSLSETAVIGNVIYGVNSSGKSSFLKAVGLAVIMAQAGLFVAAESMQFKPVKRILTRICGKDDIEKGHSSFIVELNEIRSILLKADSDSLSLCDELSKGTETDSAQALNYTLFENMSKRNSKFVTTTHLHDIADDLGKFDNIKIFHIKVLFDHNGIAIFERKLHPGPGPHLYGLEIARNMNFPQKFIEKAMEYRNSKNPFRKSRYNSKHIVISCKNCKYRPKNETEIPVEVHHINFQCNADSYGLPIHNQSNLVNLCRKCHTLVHQGQLKIIVQQTLKGRNFIFKVEEGF